MNENTKVVNIYPSMPIIGVNPPIRSTVKHVTKSIKEIRTCLMSRAVIEEVLPGGKTIRLNIGNYDKVLTDEVKPSNTSESVKSEESTNTETDKTEWDIAYKKALDGKDLTSMTRKQRRSALAAAKAEADAAVSDNNTKFVKVTESTKEDTVNITEVSETNISEETIDSEEVVTADAEDISSIIE